MVPLPSPTNPLLSSAIWSQHLLGSCCLMSCPISSCGFRIACAQNHTTASQSVCSARQQTETRLNADSKIRHFQVRWNISFFLKINLLLGPRGLPNSPQGFIHKWVTAGAQCCTPNAIPSSSAFGRTLQRPSSHFPNTNCSCRPPQTSYLGPADMTGQLASVQNSVMVPYSILIWLKKSTAGKETHQVDSNCNS